MSISWWFRRFWMKRNPGYVKYKHTVCIQIGHLPGHWLGRGTLNTNIKLFCTFIQMACQGTGYGGLNLKWTCCVYLYRWPVRLLVGEDHVVHDARSINTGPCGYGRHQVGGRPPWADRRVRARSMLPPTSWLQLAVLGGIAVGEGLVSGVILLVLNKVLSVRRFVGLTVDLSLGLGGKEVDSHSDQSRGNDLSHDDPS